MECKERDVLAEKHRKAQMQLEARVRAIKDRQGSEFLNQKAEAVHQAQIDARKAREALDKHRAEHGC